MKRLLAVFAHPDDESGFAGSLAHYAKQGVHVALVCATKGEAGEISDPSLATPANLGAKREAELRCASEVIGISELHFLGYCDSGMINTPENERPTAFIQADADEIRFKLVKLIRDIKPQVVITFEPQGWYGHPDHIAAGRFATEAYFLANDPAAFPEAGSPWKPARLFHAAFLRSSFKQIADYVREHEEDTELFDSIPFDEPDPVEDQITHVMDVASYSKLKEQALRCHQTQFGGDSFYFKVPSELRMESWGEEHFIQVDPSPGPADSAKSDLFDGIAG